MQDWGSRKILCLPSCRRERVLISWSKLWTHSTHFSIKAGWHGKRPSTYPTLSIYIQPVETKRSGKELEWNIHKYTPYIPHSRFQLDSDRCPATIFFWAEHTWLNWFNAHPQAGEVAKREEPCYHQPEKTSEREKNIMARVKIFHNQIETRRIRMILTIWCNCKPKRKTKGTHLAKNTFREVNIQNQKPPNLSFNHPSHQITARLYSRPTQNP